MLIYEIKVIKNDLEIIEQKFQPTIFTKAKAALITLEKFQKIVSKSTLRKTPSSMKRRSSKLPNSFTHEGPVRKGNIISGKSGSNVAYARIHEEGGTITAGKTSTRLTIPVKGSGNYGTAKSLRSQKRTFVEKDTIFLRQGEEIIPIFSLRRSVNVPATRYLTIASQKATPRILEILGKEVVVELRNV